MELRAARKTPRGSNSWGGGGVGYERHYFAYLLNTPALLVIVLAAGLGTLGAVFSGFSFI